MYLLLLLLHSVLFSSLVSGYYCNSGCVISDSYEDDGWCDCSQCEDEPNWTCASCPGCPSTCDAYTQCTGVTTENPTTDRPTTTEKPLTTSKPLTTDLSSFTCDDGCVITGSYYNDGYCDCTQCEDELIYTCATCPNCPVSCGAYVECTGEPQTTDSPQTTALSVFVCDDGCNMEASFYDDDYCDCAECEDEPNWSCSACGDCPDACGDYVECTGEPLSTEVCVDLTEDIFDYSPVTVSMNVSDFAADANNLYVYVDLEHTCLGDLSIYVQHANANKQLFGGQCGCDSDLRAYFSDYGSDELCEGSHSYDEVYDTYAMDSLTDFNSLPKNGMWNVIVEDNAGSDSGTLYEVCIGWGQRPDRGDDSDSDGNSGLSGGAIAGIVVGGIAMICCLLCFTVYCYIGSKSKPASAAPTGTSHTTAPAVYGYGGMETKAAPVTGPESAKYASAPIGPIGPSLDGDYNIGAEQYADTRWAPPGAAPVPRFQVESGVVAMAAPSSGMGPHMQAPGSVVSAPPFSAGVAPIPVGVGSAALPMEGGVVSGGYGALPMPTSAPSYESMAAAPPEYGALGAFGPGIADVRGPGYGGLGDTSVEWQPGAAAPVAFAMPANETTGSGAMGGEPPAGEWAPAPMAAAPPPAYEMPAPSYGYGADGHTFVMDGEKGGGNKME